MKKSNIISLLGFCCIVLICSCQSPSQRYLSQTKNANKILIFFYKNPAEKESVTSFKIAAIKFREIDRIRSFVLDEPFEQKNCGTIGVMQFYDDEEIIFENEFNINESCVFSTFEINGKRYNQKISSQAEKYFSGHFKTFQQIYGKKVSS